MNDIVKEIIWDEQDRDNHIYEIERVKKGYAFCYGAVVLAFMVQLRRIKSDD